MKNSWAVKCGNVWLTVGDNSGQIIWSINPFKMSVAEARDVERVAKQSGKTVEVINLDKKVKK